MINCIKAADILLPDFKKVDAEKWAVIACDQFTSEPKYWEDARAFVGNAPSTLDLILPEVYLSETKERVPEINERMKKYIDETLVEHKDTMLYIERVQSDGRVRCGIIGKIDLECYDYSKGSTSLVRATEGTVLERIPPRVEIRRNASIELPHVMLLIDDAKKNIIETIGARKSGYTLAYDTSLMLGGGSIKAWFINKSDIDSLLAALNSFADPAAMKERYSKDVPSLLFAVGDGNHSLATAKATYEELKAQIGEEAALAHPARYALCELVNLHDDALSFEPIYRAVFNVSPMILIEALKEYAENLEGDAKPQKLTYIYRGCEGTIVFRRPEHQLTVGTLQKFLDEYLECHPEAVVDYIHGEDSVKALAAEENTVGFIFEGMQKSELFTSVIFDGSLPRKTFSMGHAQDKRYYMESRKIK